MLNGIRVVEEFLTRPLHALLGVMFAAVVYLGVVTVTAGKLHAEQAKDQEVTQKYHDQVDEIYDMVIRIDENVKILKDK